jgi:hypothetical protein
MLSIYLYRTDRHVIYVFISYWSSCYLYIYIVLIVMLSIYLYRTDRHVIYTYLIKRDTSIEVIEAIKPFKRDK